MKILLNRIVREETYTIGEAYVNGTYFSYTLEDKDRGLTSSMSLKEIMAIKVKGQTAIPTGIYNVVYTWSPKFKRMLPLVENVKGYSGIRFHALNTAEQTEGCIGFGDWLGGGRIVNSKLFTEQLIIMIDVALQRGEKVSFEVR